MPDFKRANKKYFLMLCLLNGISGTEDHSPGREGRLCCYVWRFWVRAHGCVSDRKSFSGSRAILLNSSAPTVCTAVTSVRLQSQHFNTQLENSTSSPRAVSFYSLQPELWNGYSFNIRRRNVRCRWRRLKVERWSWTDVSLGRWGERHWLHFLMVEENLYCDVKKKYKV